MDNFPVYFFKEVNNFMSGGKPTFDLVLPKPELNIQNRKLDELTIYIVKSVFIKKK